LVSISTTILRVHAMNPYPCIHSISPEHNLQRTRTRYIAIPERAQASAVRYTKSPKPKKRVKTENTTA